MAMTLEAQPSPAAVVDFRAFLRVLARRKMVIAAIAGACLGAALLVALMMTPRFSSDIKILVDPRGLQILPNDLSPGAASTDLTFAVLDSQVQLIASTELLGKVIDELRLTDDPEFTADAEALPQAPSGIEGKTWAALRTLRKRIDVDRPDRTLILTVSVWTRSSAEKSRRIANAIGEAYLDLQAQNQADIARRTATALEAQLEGLSQNLSRAENELGVYRIRNNLVGGNGRLLTESELNDLTSKLSAQRIRTSELQARMDMLKRRNTGPSEIAAFAEALQSPTLNDLLARYADAKKLEADSQVSLGPRHPDVMAARAQVFQAQDLINHELTRIRRGLATEYERSKAVETALNQQIISAREFAASGQPSILRLRSLENDVAAQRTVYEAMQRRAKEVREAAALDRTNARIISPAAVQPAGYAVPRTLVVAGGLLFGLLAGVFMAAFLNQVDGRIWSAEDLTGRTRLPLITTLSRKAVIAAGSGPPQNELLEAAGLGGLPRVLRDALKTSPGAILVVSADQPAASGALALGLAAQSAREGIRTLAVDAARSRHITRACRLEDRPGLAEAGALPLALLKADVAGVPVVPAGARGAGAAGHPLPTPQAEAIVGSSDMTFIDGGAPGRQDVVPLFALAGVVLVAVTAGQSSASRILEAARTVNPHGNRFVAAVLLT